MKNIIEAINIKTREFKMVYDMVLDLGHTSLQAKQIARQILYEAKTNNMTISDSCLYVLGE